MGMCVNEASTLLDCLFHFWFQQPKFFTVKSEIYNLILSSVKCSLRKMRYYYVLYYLFLGISSLLLNQPVEFEACRTGSKRVFVFFQCRAIL